MKISYWYLILFTLCCTVSSTAQEDLKINTEEVTVQKDKKIRPYEPLAPARAAFYSAVLPGLGQAYSKKYWKIPIVYAAIGTSLYFYIDRTNEYNRFRDIYKRRLSGITDTDTEGFSDDQLISIQKTLRREQELYLLVTVGLYLLNIVDANVTAHLQQYNVSEDLSVQPQIQFDKLTVQPNYGVSLNYRF